MRHNLCKSIQSNLSLSNLLMAVFAAAKRILAVIDMNRFQPFRPINPIDPFKTAF